MKEWIKDTAAMAALMLLTALVSLVPTLFVLSFVWPEILTELVK